MKHFTVRGLLSIVFGQNEAMSEGTGTHGSYVGSQTRTPGTIGNTQNPLSEKRSEYDCWRHHQAHDA